MKRNIIQKVTATICLWMLLTSSGEAVRFELLDDHIIYEKASGQTAAHFRILEDNGQEIAARQKLEINTLTPTILNSFLPTTESLRPLRPSEGDLPSKQDKNYSTVLLQLGIMYKQQPHLFIVEKDFNHTPFWDRISYQNDRHITTADLVFEIPIYGPGQTDAQDKRLNPEAHRYNHPTGIPHKRSDRPSGFPQHNLFYYDGHTLFAGQSQQWEYYDPSEKKHYPGSHHTKSRTLDNHQGPKQEEYSIVFVKPFPLPSQSAIPHANYIGRYTKDGDLTVAERDLELNSGLFHLVWSNGTNYFLPRITQEKWRNERLGAVGFGIASYCEDYTLQLNGKIDGATILPKGLYVLLGDKTENKGRDARREIWKKLTPFPQTGDELRTIEIAQTAPTFRPAFKKTVDEIAYAIYTRHSQ